MHSFEQKLPGPNSGLAGLSHIIRSQIGAFTTPQALSNVVILITWILVAPFHHQSDHTDCIMLGSCQDD